MYELIGFSIKKFISAFLLPFPICLCLIIFGLIFLWFTRKQKLGKIFVTVGALLLLVLSLSVVSNLLVLKLDNAYLAYTPSKSNPVKFVVVLSGGANHKYGIPMNTSGDRITLVRLMEGIRVYKSNPGSKLILTGRAIPPRTPFSIIEASLLVSLGIPKDDIILDTQSLDTSEEALNVKKIVGDEPFVLVTSSSHMTRAFKLFHKQGMTPIPAPTDFESDSDSLSVNDFIPNTGSLNSLDGITHEYIGLVWSKLRGQL